MRQRSEGYAGSRKERTNAFEPRGQGRRRAMLLALVLSALLPRRDASALGGESGLCTDPVQNYFSCKTGNGKLIELCGGKTVEYRFGKPGKIELSYPKAPADAPFRFAHYARPVTDRIEISFSAGGSDYTVFDYSEGRKRTAGVRARSARGKE